MEIGRQLGRQACGSDEMFEGDDHHATPGAGRFANRTWDEIQREP